MVDSRFHFNGEELEAQDLEYPAVCYNIYDTADGQKISFAMVEDKFWRTFCADAGLEELIPVQLCRRQEAPWAFEKMEAFVASKTLDEWNRWLEGKDICVAPVLSKAEAIRDIVASGTGMMKYCDFPITGRVIQTNIPHHISNLPASLDEVSPPPVLGQNNLEVLLGLGYTKADAHRLAADGAINAVIE
jgi:crotonobetainyl-CoA:carnitine CoA-transferase CaiB-like acyl-CoA transferase